MGLWKKKKKKVCENEHNVKCERQFGINFVWSYLHDKLVGPTNQGQAIIMIEILRYILSSREGREGVREVEREAEREGVRER